MQSRNKKVIYSLILCFMLLFIQISAFPTTVSAATKDITITLEKDYNICDFNITLPDDRAYTVTVIPKGGGESVVAEKTDNKNIVVAKLNNCKRGDYIVRVETVDQADEIPIGKVTVSVTASRDTAESISSDIKVARDIIGLKAYFKDDNIVVEWTDETVGNVNVDIINTKTHEILYSETQWEDKHVEYTLPDTVMQVTVSVIPNESAGILDAQKQITLSRNQKHNASVSFNDISYTNEDNFSCYVTLEEPYGIAVYVNDNLATKRELLKEGKHDIKVALKDGLNNVVVYTIDENYNMFSTSKTVTKDLIAPTLMIKDQYDGIETYESFIDLNGTVLEADMFSINNEDIPINADGTFSHSYQLHEGLNTITITATDFAGNESTYIATVTQLVEEEPTYPPIMEILSSLFPFIVIVIGAIIVFIKKKGMKKKKSFKQPQKPVPKSRQKNGSATSKKTDEPRKAPPKKPVPKKYTDKNKTTK